MQKTFLFDDLDKTDLAIDAVYAGGSKGNAGDDPIDRVVGGGNQGGFRYLGSPRNNDLKLCVLYSELSDPDWPDELNQESGTFVYYGDNKRPGHELHETSRGGNLILRNVFADLHHGRRSGIPPLFVFTKGQKGRDVIFRGLAVPGAIGIPQTEDLVAIWKSKAGQRFQNYRAIFTILNVPGISRAWLNELKRGTRHSENAPEPWVNWINGGGYTPLEAMPVTRVRSRGEQLPTDEHNIKILRLIVSFFKKHADREYAFERCAGELVRMMDSNVHEIELTRFWRDGGRDGLGKYRIGTGLTNILVEFAVEAKCKEPSLAQSSGVRETTRLISRLRYRQFGVFVTTSCVHEQAYAEIVEDGHPVLIIAGLDICNILQKSGFNSEEAVGQWLQMNFSAAVSRRSA